MLPLGLKLHFSRVHFATLVADAVQAAPKNRVHRAYWQAQKSQNLAGAGGTWILRWFRNKGPSGKKNVKFCAVKIILKIFRRTFSARFF